MSDYAWSKSSLKSVLENCSWQWALRKVYNFDDHGSPQTAMGTGVHKAIEEWEKSGRVLSMEEMASIAADSAFQECKVLPIEQWFEHATDPEQVIEYAKKSVELWWNYSGTKGASIRDIVSEYDWLGSEVYWNYPSGGFQIHGYIDTVYETDRHVIIVDNKTASSMRRWKYDQEMNIEAALYYELATKAQNDGQLPDKPLSFQYHVMSAKEGKSRIVEMPYYSSESYGLLHSALTDAEAIRKHQAFRPRPDWNLCSKKYCAFFDGCRVDGTLTPYSLTTSNVPMLDTSTSTPLEVPAKG